MFQNMGWGLGTSVQQAAWKVSVIITCRSSQKAGGSVRSNLLRRHLSDNIYEKNKCAHSWPIRVQKEWDARWKYCLFFIR